MSDSEHVAKTPTVVPREPSESTVHKESVPPKRQKLSLTPTTSVPGGFEPAMMAALIADQIQKFLPQAVSQHYSTLVAEKRKEEEENESEEEEEEDTSTSEEDVSAPMSVVNRAPPVLPQSDFNVLDNISSNVSRLDETQMDVVPSGLRELVHFVNHTNKYETAVSTPPVSLMRSSIQVQPHQQLDFLPASPAFPGYLEQIRQKLISTDGSKDRFPVPPKCYQKYKEHGEYLSPPQSIIQADYTLCLRGLSFKEAKGSFKVKDTVTLQGTQSRYFESSIVDLSKVMNYMDSFTLSVKTVSETVSDHLKAMQPHADDIEDQDVIVPLALIQKLKNVTVPLVDKITLLAEAQAHMLEDSMHFLAFQMATLQLARRDSALTNLHSKVSPDVKDMLRLSPFAKTMLFEQEAVQKAKSLKEKDMDSSYLYYQFNSAKPQRTAPPRKRKPKPKRQAPPKRQQQQQQKQQTQLRKGGKGGQGKSRKRAAPKKQGI